MYSYIYNVECCRCCACWMYHVFGVNDRNDPDLDETECDVKRRIESRVTMFYYISKTCYPPQIPTFGWVSVLCSYHHREIAMRESIQ